MLAAPTTWPVWPLLPVSTMLLVFGLFLLVWPA
jgi:hypothetical protein